ncbi:hypothetical protein H9L39_09785 [Fusarium oxysporum f. sp. albedinis]|nr:hypothetical protein H9L39_09785 [Fusarium oxysporum f. sp. albedinis]
MIPNADSARMPFRSGQDTAHLRRFILAQPSRPQKLRQVSDLAIEAKSWNLTQQTFWSLG